MEKQKIIKQTFHCKRVFKNQMIDELALWLILVKFNDF